VRSIDLWNTIAMMIISFAWTSPALIAGAKTCTRRDWNPEYAMRFKKDDVCLAYDKQPRFGGKPVAKIQLIADPIFENTKLAPDSDYQAEGFAWLKAHGIKVIGKYDISYLWKVWKMDGFDKWVVRFKLIELI
jgi:hypothetical protein